MQFRRPSQLAVEKRRTLVGAAAVVITFSLFAFFLPA